MLRISYARSLETPFNENLVIASTGCNYPFLAILIPPPGVTCNLGPIHPGWRNEFHAGLQQAFGRHLVVDGEYVWKYTHNGYDFGTVGASPIYFPIEWTRSKIPGWDLRATVPNYHGFSAFVVACPAWPRASSRRKSPGCPSSPRSAASSALTTTSISTRRRTLSTSRGSAGRGSRLTGDTTAGWWPVRRRAITRQLRPATHIDHAEWPTRDKHAEHHYQRAPDCRPGVPGRVHLQRRGRNPAGSA